MSKAFIKEELLDEDDEESSASESSLPRGKKNYITLSGAKKLKEELHDLLSLKRPQVTAVVAWAAANGDRSENADYIYGKRRLREIDRRIRFLQKRIEAFEIVDPETIDSQEIVFGATVTVEDETGQKTYVIVGVDETNPSCGLISWISPLGSALLRKSVGDLVSFTTPRGVRELEIIRIEYKAIISV